MHIHTDIIHLSVFALGTALIFHILRGIGSYLGGKGMTVPGQIIGGIATFN